MKVIQVHLGLLPIPPNGWGAIEKIIWDYYLQLNKKGLQCEIKYLDDIKYLIGIYIIFGVYHIFLRSMIIMHICMAKILLYLQKI